MQTAVTIFFQILSVIHRRLNLAALGQFAHAVSKGFWVQVQRRLVHQVASTNHTGSDNAGFLDSVLELLSRDNGDLGRGLLLFAHIVVVAVRAQHGAQRDRSCDLGGGGGDRKGDRHLGVQPASK